MRWLERKGEIDFVITKKNNIHKILALVESKARLFDIGHGFR